MSEGYEAYTDFAQVYDLFMDNVPYEEWAEGIAQILREHGITDGTVLDLGCGTGKLTRLMAQKGYDLIGVDNSIEMLEVAREYEMQEEAAVPSEEEEGQENQILYLCQDMRELELYDTVRAVYSACDSVNYILEEEELLRVFQRVNQSLDPQGIFLFDCNTPYKYEVLLGENTFAENREESSFIWENYYDEESRINQYDLTLYIAAQDGLFQRFEETHLQKNYETDTIRRLLLRAGMEIEGVYDAYTKEPPREDTERVMFVARNCEKPAEGVLTKEKSA